MGQETVEHLSSELVLQELLVQVAQFHLLLVQAAEHLDLQITILELGLSLEEDYHK